MKILVLRFSSIGDIVLTTPVVRALATQLPGAEVHFATKPAFRQLFDGNPYVARTHVLNGALGELIATLKAERFDHIVDLHNNLRTRLLTLQLGVPITRFDKLNWEKWLLVNFKINRLPPVHIVQRYLAAAAPLGVRDDGQGLDYFIPPDQEVSLSALPATHREGYVALVIGAAHATKRLPLEKLIALCVNLAQPIVLVGGPDDAAVAEELVRHFAQHPGNGHTLIFNACGQFRLHGSASLVRQARVVYTHDTGLMHIAAAFQKPIVSFWGNTVPAFGMTPFRTEYEVREVLGLPCRPCSKIGYAKCPQGHFKCMREQNVA